MIRNKNIVIFGLQPWDIAIGSNCKNIAAEFAKHNKVLYINRPLDRISWIKNKKDDITQNRVEVLNNQRPALHSPQENLWVLTPPIILESVQWINSYLLFQFFNRWNNEKLANIIKQYIKLLGFDDFILFNDSAMFQGAHLKELLQPDLFIYYIRDYLIAQPYFKKHGPKAEKQIITAADLVVTNSIYLTNYASKYNLNSYYIGQGCDFENFQPEKITDAHLSLKNIPKPIIGYVGNLTSSRLDIGLLEFLAQKNPNWSIALVGNEDEAFKNSKLHLLKNVYFLGFQQPETLPHFIHGFDVCINPQALNELSIGNYPRKIDEYLAMGKPVVATKTEGMDIFKDHVRLAENKEEFELEIKDALKDNTPILSIKRIQFAHSHTWENSVLAIWNAVRNKAML